MKGLASIHFGATVRHPVTVGGGAVDYKPTAIRYPADIGPPSQCVRVWATIHINIAVGLDAVATPIDLPLAPQTEIYIQVNAGENLSAILSDGESSGVVYFTPVRRT